MAKFLGYWVVTDTSRLVHRNNPDRLRLPTLNRKMPDDMWCNRLLALALWQLQAHLFYHSFSNLQPLRTATNFIAAPCFHCHFWRAPMRGQVPDRKAPPHLA